MTAPEALVERVLADLVVDPDGPLLLPDLAWAHEAAIALLERTPGGTIIVVADAARDWRVYCIGDKRRPTPLHRPPGFVARLWSVLRRCLARPALRSRKDLSDRLPVQLSSGSDGPSNQTLLTFLFVFAALRPSFSGAGGEGPATLVFTRDDALLILGWAAGDPLKREAGAAPLAIRTLHATRPTGHAALEAADRAPGLLRRVISICA